MKPLLSYLSFLLIILVLETKSQITLEHTYPNAGFYSSASTGSTTVYYAQRPFYLVKLEVSGEKYVKIDFQNQVLTFYNLNHTLFKTISYAAVNLVAPVQPFFEKASANILYISEKLFDNDNEIEFMYCYNWGNNPVSITQIVNENGSIMFTANNEVPLVKQNIHNQYYPIYNTAAGTKMILSKSDSSARVYGLSGVFTEMISSNNIFGENEFCLAPNPVQKSGSIIVQYTLPDGLETAELKVTDLQGKTLMSFHLSDKNGSIEILQSNLEPGLYNYSITNGNTVIESKKSIVIQ